MDHALEAPRTSPLFIMQCASSALSPSPKRPLPTTQCHTRPERSDERPRRRKAMLNLLDRSDDLLLRYSFSLPRVSRIRSAAVLLTAPIDSANTMRLTSRCSGSPSNAVASALYRLRSSRSCGVCDRERGGSN